MSLYFLLFAGTTPLGSVITGVLADVIGVRATVTILGGMCVCVFGAALGLLWLRKRADVGSVYRGMQTDAWRGGVRRMAALRIGYKASAEQFGPRSSWSSPCAPKSRASTA